MAIKPVVWSTSRADCMMQCLHKYDQVYNHKIKEESHALTLGTSIHEIIADELCSHNDNPEILQDRLDSLGIEDPDIYAMVPNISKFVKDWNERSKRDGLEATIEKQYAVDKNFNMTDFMGSDAYIRGVFDMYAYDEANKRLIVIDHKSSKSCLSKAKVKAHPQLNLYVVMLTRMFNLDWEIAEIALHYVKFGKVVWADLDRNEMEVFEKKYKHLLSILDKRIYDAYENDVWPATPGFYCSWCSFKKNCPAHPKV